MTAPSPNAPDASAESPDCGCPTRSSPQPRWSDVLVSHETPNTSSRSGVCESERCSESHSVREGRARRSPLTRPALRAVPRSERDTRREPPLRLRTFAGPAAVSADAFVVAAGRVPAAVVRSTPVPEHRRHGRTVGASAPRCRFSFTIPAWPDGRSSSKRDVPLCNGAEVRCPDAINVNE